MLPLPSTASPCDRPLLRWHGGKWLLAPWILSHFPPHRVYVEPYGGAGSVLLRKTRSYAEVYNDLDGEVVNLFRVARDRGPELRNRLSLTPFAREEFVSSYEASGDALEQARKTVVRSFMGFGSNSHNKKTGFRSNSNRSGTTPAQDWKNYPDSLEYVISRLRGVVIENRDAVDLMAAHDAIGTLHYVNPPYVAQTRDKGGDYRREMDDSAHHTLLAFLKNLRGMVILSGYANPLYDEMLEGWRRETKPAHADGGRDRTEVLWLKGVPEHEPLLPGVAEAYQALNPDALPSGGDRGIPITI